MRTPTVSAMALVLVLAGCTSSVSPAPSTVPPSVTAPSPSAAPSAARSSTPSERPSPSPDPNSAVGDPARVLVDLELVVDGLANPVYLTGAGDGSDRLFVVEQGGVIRIVRDGRLLARPFLDIDGRVRSGGEQGLLGLAFPPGFGSTTDRFWVHYSDSDGDTVISSFSVSADDADRADPASELVTLLVDQPYANHNGGWIGFGPDRMLYIALGDGGSGGDPHGNGQRLDTMLGKLLRIDVLAPTFGGHGEHINPPDNPFAGDVEGRNEIWSYGLRNPWRASFDRATGDLWIGDVGQDAWEEVDRSLVAEGAGRGLNYGWNVTEGRHCFEPSRGCDMSAISMPIAEYGHDEGNCSVVGGYVYRGTARPVLAGVYVFGDTCSGTIWGLASGGPMDQEPVVLKETARVISSFGQDDAGELYLTDLDSGDIYRVVGRPVG